MLRKPNKIQMIIMSIILVLNTVLSAGLALATGTVAPTTASVELAVTNDATPATDVSGLSVGLAHAPVSTVLDVYKVTSASGKYTFTGLTAIGDYVFSLNDGKSPVTEFVKVTVTKFNATGSPTKTKATWIDSSKVNLKKSGAIGGVVTDGSATNPTPITLPIRILGSGTSNVSWSVYTDKNGAFKVYLPAAKGYTLAVMGANPGTSLSKNESFNVDVSAGQLSSPLADLTNTAKWAAAADAQLGLKTTTIKADDTTISGTANAKARVVAEDVYQGTMTDLGSAIAGTDKTFKIKLTKGIVPAGRCIRVYAIDNASNGAMDPVYTGTEVATPNYTTLTPSYVGLLSVTLTTDTKATAATDIKIGVTLDTTKTFLTNVTKVVYNNGTTDCTLTNNMYSLTTAGKLVILAGNVPQSSATGYTFKVSSKGFSDATLTGQVVGASATAPKGNGILAANFATGSTGGTTKITVTSTVYSTDTFKVLVGSSAITGFLNNIVPSTAISITGSVYDNLSVGPTNKYIGLYEVDSNGKIYGFKAFTAATAATKAITLTAPTANALTVSGSVYNLTLKVDTQLLSKTLAPAAAFKLTVGTKAAVAASTATITNGTDNTSSVVLGFTLTSLTAADPVKVTYTKGTGGLADTNGNVVATTTLENLTKSSDIK